MLGPSVHRRVQRDDLADLGEEQGHRVLGDLPVKDPGKIDDDNAKLGRGRDVEVVEADPEGADGLQVGELGKQLPAHGNRSLVDRLDVLGDR